MQLTAEKVRTEAAAGLVSLQDVFREYRKGRETVPVLQRLDFAINEGDFLAIMGPSGSGKSTLLNLIGGLDRPNAGRIEIGGTPIDRLNRRQLAAWRAKQVGFVFQFYNLIPVLSALGNVELPLSLLPIDGRSRRQRAETALQIVGLSDRSSHYPSELSGGEQQRVAIARAIVTDPALLLCDEPTGDLDRRSGEQILDLLAMLNAEHGKTIIMVTHDPSAAERAHRIVRLDGGALVQTERSEP